MTVSDPMVKTSIKASQGVGPSYLTMIGIEGSPDPIVKKTPSPPAGIKCFETAWSHQHQKVATSEELLKYDFVEDVVHSAKRRKTSSQDSPSKSSKKERKISFDNKVKVLPIPMRTEYSSRIRHRLWSNTTEIHKNAARNAVEFASEGWNWRTVVCEEGMHLCSITGELIHPIHYKNAGVGLGEHVL